MIDRKVFSYLILGLVGALLLSVAGVIVLTATDHDVPGVLENVTVGLVTGLLGLFAKTPTGDPQPVQVVNEGPGEAVPVEGTP